MKTQPKVRRTPEGVLHVPPALMGTIPPKTLAGALITRLRDLIIIVPLDRGHTYYAGRSAWEFTSRGDKAAA